MKKIIATLAFVVCFAGIALAQDELSFERKQAIDSLALEKVRDLSKYIKIVGSKETPFSEANRVIDRAEELFWCLLAQFQPNHLLSCPQVFRAPDALELRPCRD